MMALNFLLNMDIFLCRLKTKLRNNVSWNVLCEFIYVERRQFIHM